MEIRYIDSSDDRKAISRWTLEENKRARQFYENVGFVCTNEYLGESIGGKDLREVRYVYRCAWGSTYNNKQIDKSAVSRGKL